MIELVFIACSIVQGAKCHEVTLTFDEVSMMTCLMHAQEPIADWKQSHPNFSIGRYTCQPAGMYAKM